MKPDACCETQKKHCTWILTHIQRKAFQPLKFPYNIPSVQKQKEKV